MAYVHINKKTNKVRVFGSVKSLSKALKIPIDNLYTTFSRKKLKEHKTDEYRIVKTKIERA